MAEVVNVLVAFAVIVFLFRWATGGKDSPADQSTAAALGFRPKRVTDEMVNTIQNMFPDIPRDNIRYDLLRTGSVEITTNKLLERGYLDAPPPAYFTVYPRIGQSTRPASNSSTASTSTTTAVKPKSENLIARYHLEERIRAQKEAGAAVEDAGGKAVWEETPEKREASLRERKAQMILAARQRLLEQQKANATESSLSRP